MTRVHASESYASMLMMLLCEWHALRNDAHYDSGISRALMCVHGRMGCGLAVLLADAGGAGV